MSACCDCDCDPCDCRAGIVASGRLIASTAITTEPEPRWRTGRSLGRTLYRDDVCVAVCVGPDEEAKATAWAIVEAMNHMSSAQKWRARSLAADDLLRDVIDTFYMDDDGEPTWAGAGLGKRIADHIGRATARNKARPPSLEADRDTWKATASALRINESLVSGALCDAGDVVVDPPQDGVRELVRQRDEARAARDAVTKLWTEGSGDLIARVHELEAALMRLREWDMLNPASGISDGPHFRALIDVALGIPVDPAPERGDHRDGK